jgi:outer membrane protein insertion porin family
MKLKSKILNKNNFNSPLGFSGYLIPLQELGILLICLFLFSCSGTRQLPKGEHLYTGAVVKFESTEKVSTSSIKTAVEAAIRPTPNSSYFGIRPQLCLYLAAGVNPKSKLKLWLQKMGQAPVLLTNVSPTATAAIIDAQLFNLGVFNSYTTFKIIEKKHTASIIYTSHIHKPYTIKELVYTLAPLNTPKRDLKNLSDLILSDRGNSLLKPGEIYKLELLKAERIRIDALLKNNGYFYFNPDYLLFKADTSVVSHSISLELTLKDSLAIQALTVYRINKVFIDQNYSLTEDTTDNANDTLHFKNTVFMGNKVEMNIYPKVILQSVYLHKYDIYSRLNHNITLNRLMSMGNFKFVQVKFAESDTIANGYLDATILMTPMTNYTFRAELDLVTKSNNFTGPRMNLSLLDRNTFKGAELLNLNVAGSFESQLSGANRNLFSYSINPQIELTVPRFLVPFNIKPSNSLYIPKTSFTLSYNFLKRVNYFDMSTFQFTYGFKWKESVRTEHEFNPISISNTTINNESPVFTNLLIANPFLKKSYEEQFIAGGNYSFTYNEQMVAAKKYQYYLHFTAETAGNLFSLAKVIVGETPSAENSSTVLGSIYSQYAKFSMDSRVYYNFKNTNKLAFRLFAGVAKSYGNTSTMPYNKQFFSGGPNSIRAFQINSVGPGTYLQSTANNGLLQLGGDIKLETNAEYRFGIYKFFKGALFVDAGNVWLQKSNPSNTGSPFAFNSFMNELAVGAGLGLRVDVSFFVLRFDLAMPLRKPWLADNNRWVFNKIDFTNSSWRTNNLVLNIAIGYPF